jgi:hypothetical protein
MRLEHWTSAAQQGAVAGHNAVEPHDVRHCATVPYFWSDWYGNRIQLVGVPNGEHVEILGDVDAGGFVALYRQGDQLIGAFAVNRRAEISRCRALIKGQASWDEALSTVARPAWR